MKISLIAAIGKNRELGRDNKLLWHIPEDFRRFKEITLGHPIIMGRKTFESIGKLLPDRINIIITRDSKYNLPGAVIAHSFEQAVEIAKEKLSMRGAEGDETILRNMRTITMANIEDEIFVIGGGQIFEQAIKTADKLYLTIVDRSFKADTFFPSYGEFRKTIFEKEEKSNGYKYKFIELEKI
ncbi:dihydrofolate reductase [Candidatus Microgenomates bacterium]|nr:MAG: dihydrofolate reductase [Candidatus Microgenomates bacterium]